MCRCVNVCNEDLITDQSRNLKCAQNMLNRCVPNAQVYSMLKIYSVFNLSCPMFKFSQCSFFSLSEFFSFLNVLFPNLQFSSQKNSSTPVFQSKNSSTPVFQSRNRSTPFIPRALLRLVLSELYELYSVFTITVFFLSNSP